MTAGWKLVLGLVAGVMAAPALAAEPGSNALCAPLAAALGADGEGMPTVEVTDAHLQLAKGCTQAGDPRGPRSEIWVYLQAPTQERFEEARKVFEKYRGSHGPYLGHAFCNLMYLAGEPADAGKACRAAIASDPGSVDAYVTLAKLLISERNTAELYALLDKALATFPRHVGLLDIKFRMAVATGQSPEVVGALQQQLLEANTSHAYALQISQWYLVQGGRSQALQFVERAASLPATSDAQRGNLARVHAALAAMRGARSGWHSDAPQSLSAARQLQAGLPEIRVVEAIIALDAEKPAKALEIYEGLLAAGMEKHVDWVYWAHAGVGAGKDPGELLRALEQRANPRHPALPMARSYLMLRLGRADSAQEIMAGEAGQEIQQNYLDWAYLYAGARVFDFLQLASRAGVEQQYASWEVPRADCRRPAIPESGRSWDEYGQAQFEFNEFVDCVGNWNDSATAEIRRVFPRMSQQKTAEIQTSYDKLFADYQNQVKTDRWRLNRLHDAVKEARQTRFSRTVKELPPSFQPIIIGNPSPYVLPGQR